VAGVVLSASLHKWLALAGPAAAHLTRELGSGVGVQCRERAFAESFLRGVPLDIYAVGTMWWGPAGPNYLLVM
jgi:hypothetical protein